MAAHSRDLWSCEEVSDAPTTPQCSAPWTTATCCIAQTHAQRIAAMYSITDDTAHTADFLFSTQNNWCFIHFPPAFSLAWFSNTVLLAEQLVHIKKSQTIVELSSIIKQVRQYKKKWTLSEAGLDSSTRISIWKHKAKTRILQGLTAIKTHLWIPAEGISFLLKLCHILLTGEPLLTCRCLWLLL